MEYYTGLVRKDMCQSETRSFTGATTQIGSFKHPGEESIKASVLDLKVTYLITRPPSSKAYFANDTQFERS